MTSIVRSLSARMLDARPWPLFAVLVAIAGVGTHLGVSSAAAELAAPSLSNGLCVAACAVAVCAAMLQVQLHRARAQADGLSNELAAERDRLGALVRNSPVGLLLADHDGRILLAEGECLGRAVADLDCADVFAAFGEHAEAVAAFRRCLEGHRVTAEFGVGGRVVSVVLEPQWTRGGAVRGCLCVATEVTRRRAAERKLDVSADELRRCRDELRLVLELAPMAIATYDHRGRLSHSNRAFAKLLGYSRDELCGKTADDLTHPDDIARSMETSLRLRMGSADSTRIRKRYLRKDGQAIDAVATLGVVRDAKGEAERVLVQVEDVGQRSRVDRLLERSERALETLLELSSDELLLVDDAGRVFGATAAFARLLGVEPAELLGVAADQIPPRLRGGREARDAIDRWFAAAGGEDAIECTFSHPVPHPVRLARRVLTGAAGGALGRVLLISAEIEGEVPAGPAS